MLNIPDEIKDLLHQDSCNKNIRIHFPNGERSDICNDLIVMDSVKFTESLCSQNQLKFGLCESPIFECEVVGVGNIKGATIEVSVEIECPFSASGAEWKADLQKYVYPISYGTFVVSESKRQADMIHRRILAYSILSMYDLNFSLFQLKRALYPNSSLSNFSQKVIPLICEKMQSNAFNCQKTEVTCMNFMWLISSSQYVTDAYKIVGFQLSQSTSQELYCIEIEGDVPDEVRVGFSRFAHPSAWSGAVQADPNFRLEDSYKEGGYFVYPYMSMASSADNNTFFVTSKQDAAQGCYIAVIQGRAKWNNYQIISDVDYVDRSNIHIYKLTLPDDYAYSFERVLNDSNKYVVADAKTIDLRNLVNGYLETYGTFGRLDRNNIFKLVNLKRQFGLDPDTDLYPGASLHPEGITGGNIYTNDYQNCWYDDEYTKPFGAITCQYKNTNNEDCLFTLFLTGFDEDSDVNSYQVYSLENNEIIKGSTWTENQIQAICETIASNISGVSYMPVDFKGRGLPYVEAGDTFEILTRSNDSITTIVLNRTLTGEMTLTDNYKSV